MREVAGVFLPFPQGVVGSGSKIGSRYKSMIASTNDSYCPTLRSISDKGVLPDNVAAVYEVVVDGLSEDVVKLAMCRGIHAAAARGTQIITAGNYGGELGKYKFHLHEILDNTKR